MSKFLSGAAAALLLSLPVATSPATAALPPDLRRSTLTVHREYGDGLVEVPRGVQRVRLVFHGKRGHVVDLDESCGKVSLRGPSGEVAPWISDSWRLPARGRYAFVVNRCGAGDVVQLVKVRLKPLAANGDAAVLRWRYLRPYVDWATVEVPSRGRVQVRSLSTEQVGPWGSLYLPGDPLLDIANWHQEYERSPRAIYLQAGVPISNELGTMAAGETPLVPRAGQRVILIPADHRVRARALRTSVVPAALDGAAVPVSARRNFQEVGVAFRSAGDQWVTAEVDGPLASRSESQLALVDPAGQTLVGLGQANISGSPDLWHLAEPGRYRLMVRTDPGHGSGTVRLSTVRELDQEMPADGTPLAFTAQEPGEWVVTTGHLGDASYQLTAEAAGAAEWTAAANTLPFSLCRSAFCGDYSSATLTQDQPTHYFPLHTAGPWVFLVAFGEGQTGTVSLRLSPES